MRTAFKEWAIVVDALGRGAQILILRKGGLREGSGGFRLEQRQFLLFPTLTGAVLIIAVALVYHNLRREARWPKYWY